MPSRRILVPLGVVAVAAALWLWSPGGGAVLEVSAGTNACMERLREVYAGIALFHERTGRAPAAGDGDFLQALIASGAWADTPENRARLRCPGTDTPYAARDTAAFPLARFPSGGAELEPLAACDGGDHLPHAEGVNVLYSDGSVRTLLLEREIELGHLAPGSTRIPVGPDSPVPDLRKLVAH